MSSTVRNKNQRNIGYVPSNLRSGDSELDLVAKQLNHKAYNTVNKSEEIESNAIALNSMIIERRDNKNTAKNKKRVSDMLEAKSDKPLDGIPAVSYTHLDVYKRQVMRSEARVAKFANPHCREKPL